MIIRKCIIFLALFISFTAAAQHTPLEFTYTAGANPPTPGQPLDVQVHVSDFEDLIGIQLAFAWDSTVMEIDTIPFITTDIADFNSSVFSLPSQTFDMTKGLLRVSWFSFQGAQNVEDGHHLFTMRFNVIGEPCDTTSVTVTDPPAPLMIEITNSDGKADIGAVSVDLPVMIPGTDCEIDPPPPPPGEDVKLIFSNTNVTPGDNVCIPLTVSNFDSIQTAQGGIMWDPAVLTYTGLQGFNLPTWNAGFFGTTAAAQGILTWLWIDQTGTTPATLPDNSTIVEVCFDVVGANGTSTILKVYDHPTTFLQVATTEEVDVDICEGIISVGNGPPPPADDFTLTAADIELANQTNICIDVTTDNFDAITGMQFTMNWDPTVLCYDTVTNLNNTIGIFENSFNQAGDDRLRFSWNNIETTLPDGSLLYTVCFDVKAGACDQSTSVSFIDDLVPIEITSGVMSIDYVVNGSTVTCGDIMPTINLSETVNGVSCPGDSDGSVSFTISGGTGPYDCVWSNGATDNNTTSCFQVDLPAGNIMATVTDANGVSTTETFNVPSPSAISISGNTTATTCSSNGSINYSISGGTPPYSEQWTSGINPSSVGAGTWTLLVTDANDCMATMPFTVADGCVTGCFNLNLLIFSSSCGCDGTIQVECTSGSLSSQPTSNPPLTWDANSNSFINVCSGDYTITTTDGNGTTAFAQVIQNPPTNLGGSVTDIVPAGCSGAGGTFVVTPIGGCEPHTITVGLLPNGAKVPYDPNGAYIPGDYQVCITDITGALWTQNFNIPVVSTNQININPTGIVNASCSGPGSAIINVTGGCSPTCTITSPSGTIQAFVSGQVLSLEAGTHVVNCSDNIGQTAERSFTIGLDGGNDPLSLELIPIDAPCNGMDGAVQIIAAGGCGTLSCSYDEGMTGNFINCPFGTTEIPLIPGNTTFTIVDESGATITQNVTIGIDPNAVSLITEEIGCNFINIITEGGQAPFTYTWTLPDNSTLSTEDISELTLDGDYSLRVEDAIGCSFGLTIPNFEENCIVTPEDLFGTIDVTSFFGIYNTPCARGNGICEGQLGGNIVGGDAPYVVTIVDQFGQVSSFDIQQAGDFLLNDICAGSYVVSFDDANGDSFNLGMTINVEGPPEIQITTDVISCADTGMMNGSIALFVSGGVENYTYQWNPIGGEGQQFEDISAGSYFITVTDGSNCSAAQQFIVPDCNTNTEPCFESLSIITPNGDGDNEVFLINCAETSDNTLSIYDRWGRKVYTATNYQNDWNGNDSDNMELPEGAYYWVLQMADGQIEKGTVTILKQ